MNTVDMDARPQFVARGVFLIVAAMFLTSVQDFIFKLFSTDLPLGQIFALRALLAMPLIYALARLRGIKQGVLTAALRPWTLLRSLCMTLCFLAFYAALPFLSLSTVGAANYIAPILVTLLSAHLINEPVGARGWIAVLAGFAGVVVLLQPGTDAFSPWAVLPVFGALFYALAHIVTRANCQSVPLPVMVMSLNLVMLAGGLFVSGAVLLWQPDIPTVQAYPSLLAGWAPLGLWEWGVLGLLAILTIAISAGVAGAYQVAPPPTVATFDYSYLVFAAMWDIAIFQHWPAATTIVGIVMIVSAGMMVVRRKS